MKRDFLDFWKKMSNRRQQLKFIFLLVVILGSVYFLLGRNKIRMMQHVRTTVELEFPRLYAHPFCDAENRSSLHRDVCGNLNAFVGEQTRQTYLRLMKYFGEMATKHSWVYFICCGTLLGSWRHHDVIPWDHDMDVFLELKHRQDALRIIKRQTRFVAKQCSYLKIRLYDKEYVTKEERSENCGWYKLPFLEIYFFARNSTHVYNAEHPNKVAYKLADTFPLHARPMSTFSLQAPYDTLKHLVTDFKVADVCGKDEFPAKCRQYREYLPFVHRKWINSTMEESLILNGKSLQIKQVDEKQDNIPLDPYTLATKPSSWE